MKVHCSDGVLSTASNAFTVSVAPEFFPQTARELFFDPGIGMLLNSPRLR